jgi:predicted anti-sigma-YlaC factor YlaD
VTRPEPARCDEVRELIPELAMGVAPGERRAAALAHLATCSDCRTVLQLTTDVVDELILLVPGREPPAGFEARALSAIASSTHRRGPRATWLAAAAVVLAAVGGGLVIRWTDSGDLRVADQYRRTLQVADGRYLRAADLATTSGASAGHVYAYEGSPSWVFMTLEGAPSGDYAVRLVTKDGRTRRIGECWVRGGRGSWGTAVDVPIGAVDRIEMRRADGATLIALL